MLSHYVRHSQLNQNLILDLIQKQPTAQNFSVTFIIRVADNTNIANKIEMINNTAVKASNFQNLLPKTKYRNKHILYSTSLTY